MHNPIDTRQLLNFSAIANTGSIRRAAIQLNLTTSAVSHSLKKLEEDLGCKLFTRDTRKIQLTYAGERLQTYATELLINLSKARYLVNEWNDTDHQMLRIGATNAACQYIIPLALRELKESFPNMNIQIITGNSYQLTECLEESKVDIAIYPSGSFDQRKNKTSIGTDLLEFVVNPMHPWAISKKSNIPDIDSQRIILTDTKDYTFDLVNQYFRNYNKSLLPFIEISNEEMIKRLIELDIGIGILPDWTVKKEIQSGSLQSLPLGRRKLTRHWVVAHAENKTTNFIETLFIGIVKSVAQSLFSNLVK